MQNATARLARPVARLWDRLPFSTRYRVEQAARELRARTLGDPIHLAAAADSSRFYAPERPSGYRGEWDEGDAATVAAIMGATARAPREVRRAALDLVRSYSASVAARRERARFSGWVVEAAADIVAEVCEGDDYRAAIRERADDYDHEAAARDIAEDLDYSGGISERVDSACPIYYADILRVFAECPEVEAEHSFGDEFGGDVYRHATMCIYEAIDHEARTDIEARIVEDLDDEEATRDAADEAAADLGYSTEDRDD